MAFYAGNLADPQVYDLLIAHYTKTSNPHDKSVHLRVELAYVRVSPVP